MSKYLKTYEEWNPFLSKEEKSRRAEEAKIKEEEEQKRLKEEERETKRNEAKLKLEKLNDELVLYKNEYINEIKPEYVNDKKDWYTYVVDVDYKLYRHLENEDATNKDLKIYLTSNQFGHEVYIGFLLTISIPTSKLNVPSNIEELLKRNLGNYMNNIEVTPYSTRTEFKIRLRENIEDAVSTNLKKY